MGVEQILTDYERLLSIAARFGQWSQDGDELLAQLRSRAEGLTQDGWEGRGAAAFSAEMGSTVLPALQRLVAGMAAARDVLQKTAQGMQAAEEEAAALFLPSGGPGAGRRPSTPAHSGTNQGHGGAATGSQGRSGSRQGRGEAAPARQGGGQGERGAASGQEGGGGSYRQSQQELPYAVDPRRPYGPKWEDAHPPGLPAEARQASAPGAALPYVERAAEAHNLGDTFVRTVTHLARTESGGTFARPADHFDNRPPEERGGPPIVTAWGVFQFNRDAWRRLPGTDAQSFPWESTPQQEVERPVARYAQLFREVKAAGGSDIDAARGVRLWQQKPALYKQFVGAARQHGVASAWADVPVESQAKVDRLLRKGGIL